MGVVDNVTEVLFVKVVLVKGLSRICADQRGTDGSGTIFS